MCRWNTMKNHQVRWRMNVIITWGSGRRSEGDPVMRTSSSGCGTLGQWRDEVWPLYMFFHQSCSLSQAATALMGGWRGHGTKEHRKEDDLVSKDPKDREIGKRDPLKTEVRWVFQSIKKKNDVTMRAKKGVEVPVPTVPYLIGPGPNPGFKHP